jgi:hypothetical protein
MVRYRGMKVAAMMVALGACAATQRPVLYPNAYLKSVGNAAAQSDVDQCLQLADNSGLSKSSNQVVRHGTEGAAVGAAAGSVGTLVSGGTELRTSRIGSFVPITRHRELRARCLLSGRSALVPMFPKKLANALAPRGKILYERVRYGCNPTLDVRPTS